ncbi:MAG: PHP domain-containing protein, partial [Candidatus Saccharibacteria bacterium]
MTLLDGVLLEFYGDYHIHSNYSDGQESIKQIAEAAKMQGLEEVAITDHGPAVLFSGVKNGLAYEQIIEDIKRLQEPPVKVLAGAEANIIDPNGMLDIPPNIYEELDVLICGLHPNTIPHRSAASYSMFARNYMRRLGSDRNKTVNTNTKAVVGALDNNPVDILSHPGLYFKVDLPEVARACVRNDVKFEINCGHHHPSLDDIRAASRVGVDFIVNSDAHHCWTVGKLQYGAEIIEKLDLSLKRIYNCKVGGKHEWIGKRKN